MREDTIKSYAKIKLSLGVLGKIKKNYHRIESLVSFDQKAEKIKFNILTTLIWEDQYLKWNQDLHPEYPDYIIVSNNKINFNTIWSCLSCYFCYIWIMYVLGII